MIRKTLKKVDFNGHSVCVENLRSEPVSFLCSTHFEIVTSTRKKGRIRRNERLDQERRKWSKDKEVLVKT